MLKCDKISIINPIHPKAAASYWNGVNSFLYGLFTPSEPNTNDRRKRKKNVTEIKDAILQAPIART